MDTETNRQDYESANKKDGNAIGSERSMKHTWYESSDDENSNAKSNEGKISDSKRYHGTNSDEYKLQTKTAKSKEKNVWKALLRIAKIHVRRKTSLVMRVIVEAMIASIPLRENTEACLMQVKMRIIMIIVVSVRRVIAVTAIIRKAKI